MTPLNDVMNHTGALRARRQQRQTIRRRRPREMRGFRLATNQDYRSSARNPLEHAHEKNPPSPRGIKARCKLLFPPSLPPPILPTSLARSRLIVSPHILASLKTTAVHRFCETTFAYTRAQTNDAPSRSRRISRCCYYSLTIAIAAVKACRQSV